MPKLFTFILIFLAGFYAILWAFFAFNWQRFKYVLSSDTGILIWGIIILIPILMAFIIYKGFAIKARLSNWNSVAKEFDLAQTPNKFFLKGDFDNFKLEVTGDAKRKFALEGSPAYKFSTVAAAKFTKPLPVEFKITNLNFESAKATHLFTKNPKISDILEDFNNQNFDFFLFSNEGVFVKKKGIVSDKKTLKKMIIQVKNLYETIYESSD